MARPSLEQNPARQVDARPVALYGRVSTKAQAESGLSIEMQVAELPELAERVWPNAPHILIDLDAGRSAWRGSKKRGQGRERAGTQELWQLVRDRAIRGIAVENPSRLFRDDAAALAFVDDCNDAGVEIHTLNYGQLATTGYARVQTSVLFTLAAADSDEKSRKVAATKKKNAEAGYWNGGTPPHGTCAVKEGRYLVLEATEGIDFVREAFALLDSGLSQTETAKRLGVKRENVTERIFRNRHYVGQVRHGNEWHDAKWPAFVDVAQFERVQERLRADAKMNFRNAASLPPACPSARSCVAATAGRASEATTTRRATATAITPAAVTREAAGSGIRQRTSRGRFAFTLARAPACYSMPSTPTAGMDSGRPATTGPSSPPA